MICEKCLRSELKRVPRLIKKAIKEGDLEEAVRIQHYQDFLEWVLTEDDCQRYKK